MANVPTPAPAGKQNDLPRSSHTVCILTSAVADIGGYLDHMYSDLERREPSADHKTCLTAALKLEQVFDDLSAIHDSLYPPGET
jgi:hypothetical protein